MCAIISLTNLSCIKILDNLQSEFLTNWSASGFVQRRRSRYSSVVQATLTEERPILTIAPAIEKTRKVLVSHFSKGSKLKGRYICGLYQMWLLNSEHVRSHVYISMDEPAEPPSDRDNDSILSFDNVGSSRMGPKPWKRYWFWRDILANIWICPTLLISLLNTTLLFSITS